MLQIFPAMQSLKDKEQEKKETKKKNKDLPEKKKPSPAYVLWCKDQWNEVLIHSSFVWDS